MEVLALTTLRLSVGHKQSGLFSDIYKMDEGIPGGRRRH